MKNDLFNFYKVRRGAEAVIFTNKFFKGILSSASVSALICGSVSAQTNDDKSGFDEIITTAQKRTENLQDVPISINALTSTRIERAGIDSIDQATVLLPSFTFSGGVEPRSSSIRLRGIGTQTFSLAVEPSVATVIDGVVTGQGGAALEDLADVERIEVLRGPQGTLFGKNASAGVVNIITKGTNPDEFEGYVKAGIAEDGEYRLKGAVTGPLNDKVSYRLNAFYREFDGFAKNVHTGENVGGINGSWGLRGKVRAHFSDGFDATLTLEVSEKDSECCVRAGRVQFQPGSAGDLFGQFVPVGLENVDISDDVPAFSFTTTKAAILEANWDVFSGSTVTYVGGYRNWFNKAFLDSDSTPFNLVPFQGGRSDSDVFSHELRLASPEHDTYDYVVGLYYFKQSANRGFSDDMCQPHRLSSPVIRDDVNFTIPACFVPGTTRERDSALALESENYAAFGHVNWHLSDALTIFGGLRALKENTSVNADISVEGFGSTVTNNNIREGKTDDTAIIYKAGAQYRINDDVQLYGFYSTGYKGRAFNLGVGTSENDVNNPLDPEESKSIEFGLKSRLIDNRLQFNAALFSTDIDGFQANSRDPDTNLTIFRNAGTVRTQGVEVDAVALLADNFTVIGGVTFADTEFNEFIGAPCYFRQSAELGCVGRVQDLSGRAFPNAPKVKMTLSAQLDYSIGDWSGNISPSYVWQDDVVFDSRQNPNTIQESYGILNLNLGLTSPDGKYEINVFGRNLTDQFYTSGIFNYNAAGGVRGGRAYYHTFNRDAQRYFGGSVKANF